MDSGIQMGPHARSRSLGQEDNHHHAQQSLQPRPTKMMDAASVAVQRRLKPQTTFSKPISSAWTISYGFTMARQTNPRPHSSNSMPLVQTRSYTLTQVGLRGILRTAMALSEATTEWPSTPAEQQSRSPEKHAEDTVAQRRCIFPMRPPTESGHLKNATVRGSSSHIREDTYT